MRRTLTACRDGLAVTAAALLLTACGGSDDDTSSSSESAGETTSSASESSAAAADSEFCTDAASIQERVTATFNAQSDPAALPQALQEAATAVRDVEPPEEIAADWATLADGIDRIAQALATIDPNDPNALATLQTELAELQQDVGAASASVSAYLRDECGLDVDTPESSAPTS
jgi:hypothetical protein